MNITQLQILVNNLHSRIEVLNESLVRLLIERDNLHMEQDSMLVDVEDLIQYCKTLHTHLQGVLKGCRGWGSIGKRGR